MTAAAAMWAGAGLGAASSIQQGFGAARQSEIAEDEAKRSARIADMNARMMRQQGSAREEQVRRSAERQIARQRAGLAETGGDISGGTPLALLEQSDVEKELDALTVRYNAELQARSQALQADRFRTRADALSGQQLPSMVSGGLGAASQLATIPYFTRRPGAPTGTIGSGMSRPVRWRQGGRNLGPFAGTPTGFGST